ncbi:MAG: hypothetical protein IH968_10935 [Gemmatimonadetes bacterium]|nr:hypothetical protein [Gemmatimonadota bacterium]
MSTGIVARKERDGQAPPDPSREVLDQIRTTAHVCLVKVGAPLISSFELSYFVAEVYEERGPQAFFVDYEGWKGPQSLEETAPEVLVSKDDVRRYVQMFLGPMLLWPPARPRWQERAAVSSLLTALRVREFGG